MHLTIASSAVPFSPEETLPIIPAIPGILYLPAPSPSMNVNGARFGGKAAVFRFEWSGWEELNTPSSNWKSDALALSYTRINRTGKCPRILAGCRRKHFRPLHSASAAIDGFRSSISKYFVRRPRKAANKFFGKILINPW